MDPDEPLSDAASEPKNLKEMTKSGINRDGVKGDRVGPFDENEKLIECTNLDDRRNEIESRCSC
jgi:hypothetical protein